MGTNLQHSQDDSFTVNGKLVLPVQYSAGRTSSRFLISLRDEKKVMGTKCPECNKVFVPPRMVCERHITVKCAEWVSLSGKGSVSGFTVIRYREPYQPCEPPYILALIKLDGADSSLVHIVKEILPDKIAVGLRVKPVFAESDKSSILNLAYFVRDES